MNVGWARLAQIALLGCLPVFGDSIETVCSSPGSAVSQQSTGTDPLVIGEVPAYSWYHGCGPTAVGSVLGYWDLHGYPNLFDASGAGSVLYPQCAGPNLQPGAQC